VNDGEQRGFLREAFAAALSSVDIEARVADALRGARLPGGSRRGAVIAIGKASPAMARGALSMIGDRVDRVLVVAPDGTPAPGLGDRVDLLRAAHPDPDARSLVAARKAREIAGSADFLVALVSGGASSLVCEPRTISLRRYSNIARTLLAHGATVREVNTVRRHLCAIKGGGLARASRGSVLTLIVGDVIDGEAHDVGSGPTVADPTSCAEARAVLRRHAPRLAAPPMRETVAPGDPRAARWRHRVLASPRDLARAVADRLRSTYRSVRIVAPSVASIDALAQETAERARALRPGDAIVRAAEPSVHITGLPGRGGRSTHLATAVALHLPPGVAFLAGASDGVDGSSGTGGAVVDLTLAHAVSPSAIAGALRRFDTGPLLQRAGMAIPSSPTGTNLADVHVLARSW
jgi:glycerate 2-kinase